MEKLRKDLEQSVFNFKKMKKTSFGVFDFTYVNSYINKNQNCPLNLLKYSLP